MTPVNPPPYPSPYPVPNAAPPPSSSSSSSRRWAKPLRFGILGALGCLAAALLGELWLALMRPAPPPPPPPRPPQAVALVLDTSGSMDEDGKLDSVVQAAKEYLRLQSTGSDRIAVVRFGSYAEVVAPLTSDRNKLEAALDSLGINGTTGMDQGLQYGTGALQGATEPRSILLFTDGEPDDAGAALQMAQAARAAGIQVVAVATPDADQVFLGQVTGDTKKVIIAQPGAFTTAFQQAGQIISGYDLTSSAPVQGDTRSSLLVMIVNGVWTALLGLGLALALVWGQANYFRRYLFEPGSARRELLGLLGGALAGFASGVVAQVFFAAAGQAGAAELGRMIAWGMLGGILARGMALFVPNLDTRRAWLFGAGGGGAAAIGFALLSTLGSDIAGRLAGASLLGFFIGLLVAFAEEAFRRAWLHVEGTGKSEIQFDVNLGAEPIAVGADRARCLIYAPGDKPVAGRFGMEGSQAYFQPGESAREWLAPNEVRDFGPVRVTLKLPNREMVAPAYAANTPMTPGVPYAPPGAFNAPGAMTPPGVASDSAWANIPLPPGAPAPPVPPPHVAPLLATHWRLENAAQPVDIHAGQSVLLGRLPENDVVVADGTVSSRHARLECVANGPRIIDLQSTNGTWVNDVRISPDSPHTLRNGDRLRLGAVEYWVRSMN